MLSSREILEALSAGVVAAELDEIACYANPAACRLLDLSEDSCLGQSVPLLLGMTVSLSDHAAFAEGGPSEASPASHAEECRLDLDLPGGPAGMTIHRLPGRGYVCVFRTKGEGRLADDRLARDEREAAVSVLLSSFAHEVRNPLAAIQAAIDMIRTESGAGPPPLHLLDIIERQLLRLRDLARSPAFLAGRPSAHRVLCAVRELTRSAIAAVAGEAQRSEVAIVTDLSDSLPRVFVDEQGLIDAIAELLENAVHATANGGSVSLSAREALVASSNGPDRRRVVVEIEDRGDGMARCEIAPALRAFSSTKHGASGMGLPTARHYIQQSGGRLAIESVPSVGTVVRVELPAEDPR